MRICFQFDFVFFIQFNLHVIDRKVNLQAGIFKRIKFDQRKCFWTFLFDFFVRFGEFVQLDVACPMKPKQTTQAYALSSTASGQQLSFQKTENKTGCPFVVLNLKPTQGYGFSRSVQQKPKKRAFRT